MFRFFHLPTTSETDVTRNFEQLQTLLAGQLLEEYLSAGVRAKLLNPGTPSARAATTTGAEHEVSATKHALVTFTVVIAAKAIPSFQVLVAKVVTGGYQIAKTEEEQALTVPGVLVAAGQKYEMKVLSGAVKEVLESHTFLN